ncbi:MAG: hypothetical protein ACXW31_08625 [Thermoanaerobaculia bacterium]
MAEETLVKDVLTDDMITSGLALTKTLEQVGWPVVASFWFYDWETNRWRLVLASPVVDEKGPTAAYGEVFAALDVTRPAVSFESVWVVSPGDRSVRVLRSLSAEGRKLEGRHIQGLFEGGYIEDSYVYRALPASAA